MSIQLLVLILVDAALFVLDAYAKMPAPMHKVVSVIAVTILVVITIWILALCGVAYPFRLS